MKKIKFLSVFFLLISAFLISSSAYAACSIGKISIDKVLSNYSKAQDVSADIKVKEAELQKFLADAQKKLKDTTSPVEKKNLEDKLSNEFRDKRNKFQEEQVSRWKDIEDNVYKAIQQVAKDKNLEVVLNDQSIILGGVDITDQVISILNSTAVPASK